MEIFLSDIESNYKESELAHKEFLIAYDLSGKNKRIRASVMANLGLLHLTLKNYSLAQHYLLQRESYGFVNEIESFFSKTLLAKANFHLGNYKKALYLLDSVSDLFSRRALSTADHSYKNYFYSQCAFYAYYSNEYKKSLNYLSKVNIEKLSLKNLVTYHFLWANNWRQLKSDKSAREGYEASYKHLLEGLRKGDFLLQSQWVKRIKILLLGFLSQFGVEGQKQAYLIDRIETLQSLDGESDRFGLKEYDRLSYLVKSFYQLADLQFRAKVPILAFKSLSSALPLLSKMKTIEPNDISPRLTQPIYNYYLLALSNFDRSVLNDRLLKEKIVVDEIFDSYRELVKSFKVLSSQKSLEIIQMGFAKNTLSMMYSLEKNQPIALDNQSLQKIYKTWLEEFSTTPIGLKEERLLRDYFNLMLTYVKAEA